MNHLAVLGQVAVDGAAHGFAVPDSGHIVGVGNGGAAGSGLGKLPTVLPGEVPRLGIVPVGGIADGIIADGMVVISSQQIGPLYQDAICSSCTILFDNELVLFQSTTGYNM